MAAMVWKEVNPEQSEWERQINVMAYYGDYKIASIILCDGEWSSVIDDEKFIIAETEDEAKEEMIKRLDKHFTDEINYYQELRDGLGELSTAAK